MSIIKHLITVPRNAQVFVFDLNNQINHNQIVNSVLSFKDRYPDSNTSNVIAWHTDYFAHKHTTDFDQLIIAVEDCVRTALNDNDFNVSVVQCWASIYNKGEGTALHDHSDRLYSAVYYAEAASNASPLKFEGGLIINPEPGMLVCFPSWLKHEVPAMRYSSRRISIAFNINCTLKSFEERT